jgi:hypothetical protein
MPTLSLSLAQTGPPPESDTARANGGTEGREGQTTVDTTGGVEQQTWTRTLQSYMEKNKESTDSSGVAGPSGNQGQSKSQGELVPALAPITLPAVLQQVQTPVAGQQTGDAALDTASSSTNSTPHKKTNQSSLDSLAEGLLSNQSALVPMAIASVASAPFVGAGHSGAGSVVTKSVQPAGNPAIAAGFSIQTGVSVAGTVVPQANLKTSTVPGATTNTLGDTISARSGASQSPMLSQINTPVAQAADSSDTSATQSVPGSPAPSVNSTSQPLTLEKNTTPAITAALQEAQVSSVTAASTVLAQGPTKNPPNSVPVSGASSTTDDMERAQVLGDHSAVSVVKSSNGKDAGEKQTGLASDGATDPAKPADKAGNDPSNSGFSNVLSTATTASDAPVSSSAANADLVQSSSRDERMGVINQISQHIQAMKPDSSAPNTMTVTVQPPHWGEVKIAVTLDPAQTAGVSSTSISATVTASTSEVQGALQQHVQDLKDSLGSVGLHMEKLDVALSTVNAMSQSSGSTGQHAGQQGNSQNYQNFQGDWANSSMNPSGSQGQFQSGAGWTPSENGTASPTSTLVSADLAPASANSTVSEHLNSSRIDMRA